jgi:hypothetical protein
MKGTHLRGSDYLPGAALHHVPILKTLPACCYSFAVAQIVWYAADVTLIRVRRTCVLWAAGRVAAEIEGEGLRKAARRKCCDFVDPNWGHACKKGIIGMFAHTPSGR